MKLKLVGKRVAYIPTLNVVAYRGDVIDVPKKINGRSINQESVVSSLLAQGFENHKERVSINFDEESKQAKPEKKKKGDK